MFIEENKEFLSDFVGRMIKKEVLFSD